MNGRAPHVDPSAPHYFVAPTRSVMQQDRVVEGPCVRCGREREASVHLRPPGEASVDAQAATG